MSKVNPCHTKSYEEPTEHRNVYHDHDNCPDGKRIKAKNIRNCRSTALQRVKKNTPGAAKIEHDKALPRVMLELLKDDTEVYKQFVQNESFRRFITGRCG
jgi:hypothetical protein